MRENEINRSRWPQIWLLVVTTALCVTAKAGAGVNDRESTTDKPITSTNRPMREQRDLALTVGQNEGDL